ncbi:MAG: hypothetical protein F6K35_24375 [Okeania sp. SIO2H7]|nr:hypothetical protein [Okeania sp. SIO2H7]
MKTIIAVFGLGSALLLSVGPIAIAQTEEPTLSGDSLRTVEGRSLSPRDYEDFLWEPENRRRAIEGIGRYELRRRRQETVEIVPGVSIPAEAVENQDNEIEVIIDDRGDKAGEGFKLPLSSF